MIALRTTTKRNTWTQAWADSAAEPQEQVILALVLLNGLSGDEIQALNTAYIDLDAGWITTVSGKYPMVAQVRQLIEQINPSGDLFALGQVRDLLDQNGLSEEDAHRKLAGALWITSEDTQLISSATELAEVPILPLRFTFPFSIVERLHEDSASEIAQQSLTALQAAADWLERELLTAAPVLSLRTRATKALLDGKTVFLLASTSVNGINMIFNLVMGRLLVPAAYSQLALLITLHLVIGLLPTAAQTAVARFSAIYAANGNLPAILRMRREGLRLLWIIGIVLSVLIVIAAAPLAHLFQLDNPILLLPLALGTAFYVVMSVDRGVLQGINGFYWLSAAYLSESVIRFIVSVGFGLILVSGAARLQGGSWSVGESMVVTWFIGWLALRHLKHADAPPAPDPEESQERQRWLRLAGLTLVALAGQAIIANSDFLLVQSLFPPAQAGLYAAISILGRIVYFGALPLTIILVPFIARKQALNEPTRPTLFLMLAGGTAFCGAAVLATLFFGPLIVHILYGDAYIAGASLLAPYTLAASLYVITNLVVTYRVALGRGGETWLPLAAGILQVIGILLFHQTLVAVIVVQIVLMAILLVLTLWRGLRSETA